MWCFESYGSWSIPPQKFQVGYGMTFFRPCTRVDKCSVTLDQLDASVLVVALFSRLRTAARGLSLPRMGRMQQSSFSLLLQSDRVDHRLTWGPVRHNDVWMPEIWTFCNTLHMFWACCVVRDNCQRHAAFTRFARVVYLPRSHAEAGSSPTARVDLDWTRPDYFAYVPFCNGGIFIRSAMTRPF